jgi:diguanylate cyclase
LTDILARAEQVIAPAAERLLVERLQEMLAAQGIAAIPLLSDTLLSAARDLIGLLPALLYQSDHAMMSEPARALGGAAHTRGASLSDVLHEGQRLHDQLLERIATDWRVNDRDLVRAVLQISRALRHVERQVLLAYEDHALATLTHQALSDPLTGLANRRYFDERLQDELARAQRRERPLAVILFDVDDLKVVNDSHGHAAGDTVLRAVATLLRDQARGIDVAARLGGDEFALLLPETDDVGANILLRRLLDGAAGEARQENGGARFSAGVAIYPEDGRTAEALLHEADAALYRAKRDKGR